MKPFFAFYPEGKNTVWMVKILSGIQFSLLAGLIRMKNLL